MHLPGSLSKFQGMLQSGKKMFGSNSGLLGQQRELLASSLTSPLSGLDQEQSDVGMIPRTRHAEAKQWGQGALQRCHGGCHCCFYFLLPMPTKKAKQTKTYVEFSKKETLANLVQTYQNDAFLSCSKIYRVPAERDCDRGTKCGNVLCFPKRLCFSVPGDPVVVPSGTRGPGAWD